MSSDKIYDCVVIGGGPSGLVSSMILSENLIDYLLIESGSIHRDRYNENDVANGIGGAGLYSDGKYSFYPASTELWTLNNKKLLEQSYKWLLEYLSTYTIGDELKNLLDNVNNVNNLNDSKTSDTSNKWYLKKYPSIYINLGSRMKMIDDIYKKIHNNSIFETKVNAIYKEDNYYIVKCNNKDTIVKFKTKKIICAGGRFMPLFLNLENKKVFKRIEIGVRIECSSANKIWTNMIGTDPKYIYNDGKIQWRTFCCCRDGETVVGNLNGLYTYSGRSDCPPTGRSNIGFNLRVYDPEYLEHFENMIQYLQNNKKTFEVTLDDFLDNKIDIDIYNKFLPLVQDGIRNFIKLFPELLNDTNIIIKGPTIEGVGNYNEINNDLKLENEDIWIAGDAGGRFRGIVSSMISGSYIANNIIGIKK